MPQGFRLTAPPRTQQLLAALPFGRAKEAAATAAAVQTFWQRATSDDLLYMFLTLINAYFAEVLLLQNMRAQVRHVMPDRLSVWPPMLPFSLVVTPACTCSSHCLSTPHSQSTCSMPGAAVAGHWHGCADGAEVRAADLCLRQ